MKKSRVIAFYLPQFYPTKENDEWWQRGFTEWTNVGNAKPIFKGHYQPRVPSELGYYDLRVPEVREQQVELAKEALIDGFCYWHYWFAGKRLLDRVFTEVVNTGKPDFPFCLCWANHSWYKKTWTSNGKDQLLIEQTYPGEDDYIAHFYALLSAFQDNRYMKTTNGKLLFGIFSASAIPDIDLFINTWNRLAVENGLLGFEFFAFVQGKSQLTKICTEKYGRIVYDTLHDTFQPRKTLLSKVIASIKSRLSIPEKCINYNEYVKWAIHFYSHHPELTPCIDPMFDHSPRSKNHGVILHNNNPQMWGKLCKEINNNVLNGDDVERLIFIKAWNEWGEGNYLEPDLRFGRSYIEETRKNFL